MLASRVPGQRWWFALLVAAVAVTAWRSWPAAEAMHAPAARLNDEADERPAGRGTYRLVPLLGLPLEDAVDAADGDPHAPAAAAAAEAAAAADGPVKTCLPFLAPILQHPSWQLRITSVSWTCFGPEVRDDFTVASTGEVTWTKPGWPVRHLQLTDAQLALVRRLDRMSCVEPPRAWREPRTVVIGLDLGKFDEYAGARISTVSPLGLAVTSMLDGLVEQYRQPRREVIGSMDLRLASTDPEEGYRVRIAGGRLTVERNGKRWVDEPVEPDLRIDLIDAILERRAAGGADVPPELRGAKPELRGALRMDGWSVPVALVRQERSPFAQIHRAIDSARYFEDKQRERGRPGATE